MKIYINLENHREYQHKPYRLIARIFIQIFVVGSERRTCFETQCIMALQDHPRSLILALIENALRMRFLISK